MSLPSHHDAHLCNASDRDGDALTRVDVDRGHLQGHRVQGKPVLMIVFLMLLVSQDATASDSAAWFDADAEVDAIHLCMYWIPGQTKAVPPGTSRGFRWQQPETKLFISDSCFV